MEFRVFLSSTFLDLQAEREQLVKKVFPRIRAACRERGVVFTEIDLRWGITDEEAQSGRSVRICLDEIARAPYFIGILGSRYGWIPPADLLTQDADGLEQYPWLADAVGKSITELEITYGAFAPERATSALLYEKQYPEGIAETEDIQALARLKQRIVEKGLTLNAFASPEEFGEQVYRDLAAVLDRDWPRATEHSATDQVRGLHDGYALNRTQSYVADSRYFDQFVRFVDGTDPLLVVWGRSGLGKSALMAHLTSEYQKRNPGAFFIRHFVGAATDATRAEDVIRHIMTEIAEHYGLPDELPQDDAALQQDFPAWLAKVREDDKLVIAIDAVNQLTGIGPEMHWLPGFIPQNVRIVISTTPELPLEQLRSRNAPELEVRPLDAETREKITSAFLTRYSKSLTPAQLRTIANTQSLESPLFLRTLLEELRVFGQHRALDTQLARYLHCQNEHELFQRVLERMETDFSRRVVESVMTVIWASRHGLSESELLDVTSCNRLQLSEFLIALEFHLMRRGGLYSFFHQYLRSAVEERYLSDESSRQSAHRRLAEYFGTREFAERRRDEEPWQWQEAGDLDKLQECMMRPEMVALFEEDRRVYEAYGYWRALPSIPFDESYIRELGTSGTPTAFTSFRAILKLLTTAGLFEQAAKLADIGMQLFQQIVSAEALLELSVTRAELELHRNNFERAIELSEVFLQSCRGNTRDELFMRYRLQSMRCASFYHLGKYNIAADVARDSLALAREVFGEMSVESAAAYKNLGAMLMGCEEYSQSEVFCRRAVTEYISIYGEGHPETINCRINLGIAIAYQHRLQEALQEFNLGSARLEHSLGPKHKLTITALRQVAESLARMGKTEEARSIVRQLQVRMLHLPGTNELEVSSFGIFLGYTYYLDHDYARALPYYEANIPLQEAIRGENHPNVVRFKNRREEIISKLTSSLS